MGSVSMTIIRKVVRVQHLYGNNVTVNMRKSITSFHKKSAIIHMALMKAQFYDIYRMVYADSRSNML